MKANTPLILVLPSLAASLLLCASAPAAPDTKADSTTKSQKVSSAKEAPEKAGKSTAETATGKVFSIDPTLLSVATEGNPTPIQFRYNSETPYVDEDGKTVPMDLIRPELPVTVEYATEGETLTARRIVVTRATLVGDGDKSPEKARADLADSKGRGESKSVQTDSAPQTLMGTVATVEQTIAITPRGESAPRSIVVNNSTRYVNASGQPVSSSLIFSGMPVTVKSMKDGERHIAMEVIVRGDASMSQTGMQGGPTGGGAQSGQGGQGATSGTTGTNSSRTQTSGTGSGNGTLTDGFIQPITNPGLLGGGQNQQMTPGNNNGGGQQPGQGGQANNFNPGNGTNQNNPNQGGNANNTNGTATNPNGTVNPGNNRTNAPQQNQGTNNSGTNGSTGTRAGTPSNQPNPDNRPAPAQGSNNSSGGNTATPSAGPATGGGGSGGASGGGGSSGGGGGTSGGGSGGASGGASAPSR